MITRNSLMSHFNEKEYHPIIEDYIADYCEDTLNSVERDAFEEVLVHEDELRELAHSARAGRQLMEMYKAYLLKKRM